MLPLSIVQTRGISSSCVLFRYATVTKDGTRNKDKESSEKKFPWAKVTKAGIEKTLIRRRNFIKNEEYGSCPEKAQGRSLELFDRIAQSLKTRGYSREIRAYQPREDVVEFIKTIYSSHFTCEPGKEDEWLNQPLDDLFLKFKFINDCDKQLDHEVPSPDLHLMKTVGDVVEFYKTPIRGLTTYDDLSRRQNELPANLHIINQYIRFDPENDTFFKGKDAFPKHPMVVEGIRGREKYQDIKIPFEWPDV
ncbi:uncharacterized protein LOC128391462 [Panonychus citri]|uniref:uncharacterized protein LOC128391462 n=1 Tax=Panonychus citri TaxID=50023 RepID=UPI002307601A|nr:uncharacterized protein LOC128391462 [Panonychus citri]